MAKAFFLGVGGGRGNDTKTQRQMTQKHRDKRTEKRDTLRDRQMEAERQKQRQRHRDREHTEILKKLGSCNPRG